MTDAARPKIGLLALTLELYEKLAPELRQGRDEWLRGGPLAALRQQADVVFEGAVCRRTEIEAAVAGFEAAQVDGLLVLLLSYSPSQLALPALQHTRLPILLWNTQELFAVGPAFSPAELRANHGVHGTQDLANVLLRAGVPFHYVTSHLEDADGLDEVRDFFAAASAVRRLRSTRLGLLGYPFPGMGDFAVDTTQMAATLGCSCQIMTVEDYNQRAAAAPAEAVEKLVGDYRASYAVAPDITDAELSSAARAELALRGIADGLDGFTYQFMAFGEDERTVTLPFIGASRLMGEGIGFGGEGDLISAAATRLLNWLKPPATFSEIFTVDYAGNSVLMSHMGEANVAMAARARKIALVARPTPITRTRERQLVLVTTVQPGPATFCALTLGPAGRWRILAAPVTVEDCKALPALFVPHFKVKPPGDVRRFLTDYAKAGGPHHNAVCFGDARRRLRMAAEMLGADYCEI